MESSMSLSSLSFEEDEFDNSTDNEIRFVDIEKEILSKKTDDSKNITNQLAHAKMETEKENVTQKMLHITNLGLRPKYPTEIKHYAIRSQGSKTKSISKPVAPVKHFAYRTSKVTTKQNTSPVVAQDNLNENQTNSTKIKYFATRSNVYKSEENTSLSTNDALDPLVSRINSENVAQSKWKADDAAINPSGTVGFESENEQPAPEIPNLNNIEIIDEFGNEDDSPTAEQTNTPMDIEVLDDNVESISPIKPEIKKTKHFAIRSNSSNSVLKNKSTVVPVTSTSKPLATRTAPRMSKSKSKTTPRGGFRNIAPKPGGEDQSYEKTEESTPEKSDNSIGTATADNAGKKKSKPNLKTKNANSTEAAVMMPAKSMIVHSSMSSVSNTNIPGVTSMTQSLNFVVPKEDIVKYKLNNTPLILSVPPLVSADGSQITPTTGRSLLMILPQQLPSNLQGPGVVNFLVTNPHFKPNVSVQIPTGVPPKMPNLTPLKNITSSSTNRSLLINQQKGKKGSEVASSAEEVKILNTKEKDGPNWCWYVPKFGKRDLEGFLYKDRLGFSRTETDRVRKCLRKLNIIIYKKQCELDDIASNIIKLKRGIKLVPSTSGIKPTVSTEKPIILRRKRHGSDHMSLSYTNENSSQMLESIVSQADNEIKIVSVASLSERNEFLFQEEQTDSPVMPMDDQSGDDCSSDLYYTKKVVILRNRNPNLHKRRTKRITRLPKIKLRQNRLAIQSNPKVKQQKPVLPPVKKCSVVLNRDEELEKVIREKFDLKDRSRRKRKLDLESMGLIKKVRRRNAIDTPPDKEIHKLSKIQTKSSRSETNFTATTGMKDKQDLSPVCTPPKMVPDKPSSLSYGQQKISSKTLGEHKIKTKTVGNYVMMNESIDHDELASSSSSSLKMISEKTFDFSTGHKKNAHDYKKSVFMSYRERQKISSLTHAERRFIFALNTIHSLEDLRLDDKKPLLVLDQHNTERDLLSIRFNFKFDFESMNNYNVVFTRDDDEALPLALLKNLKLVYLVRHGHIKVVSRPVLCKYLLEKCNLVKKPVEKIQMKETQSKNKDEKDIKKGREVGKPKHKVDGKDAGSTKRAVEFRHDLVPTKSLRVSPTSNTKERYKQENIREVKTTMKSCLQAPDKRRLAQKHEKETTSLINTNLKHKTDSLDTKFNEIEKNLSIMFEKAKPSTSDITKCDVANESCLKAAANAAFIKDVEMPNTEAVHGVSTDLDYLFTNSGDENSNLSKGQQNDSDVVQEGSKESGRDEKLEESKFLENSRTSVVDEDQQGGTAETLEELLTSHTSESEQVQNVHETQFAPSSSSVQFPDKPTTDTSTINENVDLSTHILVSSTQIKNDDDEIDHVPKQMDVVESNSEGLLMQMIPVPVLEEDPTKLSCSPEVQDIQMDGDVASNVKNSDEQEQDIVATETSEPDHSSEEIESGHNRQEIVPCIKDGTCAEESKYETSEHLDIEQFLTKTCSKSPSAENQDEFITEKNDGDISNRNLPLSQVCANEQNVQEDPKESTLQSEMELHEQIDISENDSNEENIFMETLSEQQNASAETDSIIPPVENLLYLIPEKACDTATIPADTSSDISIGPLQGDSSNMDDVENVSKINYTVPTFEPNEDLNEQVTENLINSGSEFELFNNTSDKVPEESTSIASRNLEFEDDTNNTESTMIMLESKKSSDTDLLSSCEIDTDIAMCSDGISKNLPDDYLEK